MLERSISLSWLLITTFVVQVGCTSTDRGSNLELCATSGATGFPQPHLVVSPAARTIEAFDVTYHLDDCSNDDFICLDGAIPYVQPMPDTNVENADFNLSDSIKVREVPSEPGGSRIEVAKDMSSLIRKVTYHFANDASLLSVEIVDEVQGQVESTRYEPCG